MHIKNGREVQYNVEKVDHLGRSAIYIILGITKSNL